MRVWETSANDPLQRRWQCALCRMSVGAGGGSTKTHISAHHMRKPVLACSLCPYTSLEWNNPQGPSRKWRWSTAMVTVGHAAQQYIPIRDFGRIWSPVG